MKSYSHLDHRTITRLKWYLDQKMDLTETQKPIRVSRHGLDAFTAFNLFINENTLVKTKHPNILRHLYSAHEVTTLAIDLLASAKAQGQITMEGLRDLRFTQNLPNWLIIEAFHKSKLLC